MRIWRHLAIASAMSAAFAVPTWANEPLQNQEDQYGNQIESNRAVTPPSYATPMPMWNGQRTYGNSTIASPEMSDGSAAQESHATGKVDASYAAPPRTGSDVQPGDMGPANAKGQ